MSIVQTGLGWYADGDWLTDITGAIGNISTGVGSFICYDPNSGQDMYLGKLGNSEITVYSDTTCYCACGSTHVTHPVNPWSDVFVMAPAGTEAVRLHTSTTNRIIYLHDVTYGGYTVATYTTGWSNVQWTNAQTLICDPDAYTTDPNVIAFAKYVSEGGSTVIAEYNKSSAGYSVTCLCKWITQYGGDVYCSPVLISSDPNYTLYSRNGSVPSVAATEHTLDGVTFYMRKAPLDVLVGTETVTSDFPIVDLSGVAQTNDTIFAAIAAQSSLGVGYPPGEEDPYAEGGNSEPSTPNGDFDDSSDDIDDSTTPTVTFAGTGFCRIYNPNLTQLNTLANYLWTDTTFLQTIINHAKQLLEDPIEAIISLAMLPVSIPNGANENVRVLFINTGVQMPPATTQYVEVNCGTLDLKEYYGSALDYNPYTQIDLFLPFIGQVSLNTDEVMGHTLQIKYRVDIVSGMCVAKIFVDGSVLYQFSGNCAIFMPLNSADFSNYLNAAIAAATALVSAGAGVAAGSAAAGAEAVAEPAVQSTGTLALGSGESLVTPEMAFQYRNEEYLRQIYAPKPDQNAVPPASLGEMERKLILNTAAAVMGSKIAFEHASHLTGNSGILGVRRPYLIISRPRMCNPEQYGKYNGRPSMMYLNLGQISGYTEVQEIQLTGFSATNPELAEISKMLKGGVIL